MERCIALWIMLTRSFLLGSWGSSGERKLKWWPLGFFFLFSSFLSKPKKNLPKEKEKESSFTNYSRWIRCDKAAIEERNWEKGVFFYRCSFHLSPTWKEGWMTFPSRAKKSEGRWHNEARGIKKWKRGEKSVGCSSLSNKKKSVRGRGKPLHPPKLLFKKRWRV